MMHLCVANTSRADLGRSMHLNGIQLLSTETDSPFTYPFPFTLPDSVESRCKYSCDTTPLHILMVESLYLSIFICGDNVSSDSRLMNENSSKRLPSASCKLNPVAEFVSTVKAYCKENQRQEALAIILDFFDDNFVSNRFGRCQEAISELDPKELTSSAIVATLAITFRAKSLLGACREVYFHKAMNALAEMKGERVAKELIARYK